MSDYDTDWHKWAKVGWGLMIRYWADTLRHKWGVARMISRAVGVLIRRAWHHDASKFYEPESSLYAWLTPKLEHIEYGSDAYYQTLDALEPALDHHYESNSHHPEFHSACGRSVHEMPLFDLIEMVCDWAAAVQRHDDDNDLEDSIVHNAGRFEYDETFGRQLAEVAQEMGLGVDPDAVARRIAESEQDDDNE